MAYWERVLNGLVVELYFPEEVIESMKDVGGRMKGSLFDLVAQAALPEAPYAKARSREEKAGSHSDSSLRVSASPRETSFLPRLRQTFETLHDGAHPLRLALDRLATLATVHIIEEPGN
ncbi:MAG: hypothetical protein ACK45B_08380 [Limisphaerales bacterium]